MAQKRRTKVPLIPHIIIRIFVSKRSQPVITKFNRYTINYLLQQKCAQVPRKNIGDFS
jgi:hypothetical protein